MERLVNALRQGRRVPPRSVVLTFDDGWENQFRYALPILMQYDFTATFFIFTNAIGRPHFLSWEQVATMDKVGMTIGGHTRFHPDLIKIKDPELLKKEIIDSKKIIESHLLKPTNLFAYPFGQYNDVIISVVKEAGYTAARGIHAGTNHVAKNLYTLTGVEATDDLNKFIKDLTI